ncbi:MAG: CBS domain-containing protein, partial [Bacteroidota bacterium]
MSAETRITKTQEMVYEMKVGGVMTTQVIAVHAEDRMGRLRGILFSKRISGLPVVDGERLVGIISVEDFIKWLADRQDDCTIKERMTA